MFTRYLSLQGRCSGRWTLLEDISEKGILQLRSIISAWSPPSRAERRNCVLDELEKEWGEGSSCGWGKRVPLIPDEGDCFFQDHEECAELEVFKT